MGGKDKKVVAVIGGGVGGSSAVSALLKAGYPVMHIDENSKVMGRKSTSAASCNGLLSGLHYGGHKQTAIEVFNASYLTMKRYTECMLESDANERGGALYLVTSESTFTLEQNRETAEAIVDRYAAVAKTDEDQVFGPPKKYIQEIKIPGQNYSQRDSSIELIEDPKILKTIPKKIPHTHIQVNSDGTKTETTVMMDVIGGFIVQEPLIDPNRLREHFQKEFQPYVESDQLRQYYSETVEDIELDDRTAFDFKISTKKTNQPSKKATYRPAAIINAAWTGIGKISQTVSKKLGSTHEELTVRPKFTIIIDIPEDAPRELHDMPTEKFISGSFCTITRNNKIGSKQGQFILTFENVGNLKEYKLSDPVPAEILELQDELYGSNKANSNKSEELASQIHHGCAVYIPEELREFFLKATIVEKRLASVMQPSKNDKQLKSDLRNPNDAAHERSLQSSIREVGVGYIELACLKLCGCAPVADVIVERLGVHFEVREQKEKEMRADGIPLLPVDEAQMQVAGIVHEAHLAVQQFASKRKRQEFIGRNAFRSENNASSAQAVDGKFTGQEIDLSFPGNANANAKHSSSEVVISLIKEERRGSEIESRESSSSATPSSSPQFKDANPLKNAVATSSSTSHLYLTSSSSSGFTTGSASASQSANTNTSNTASSSSSASAASNLSSSPPSGFSWNMSNLGRKVANAANSLFSSLNSHSNTNAGTPGLTSHKR